MFCPITAEKIYKRIYRSSKIDLLRRLAAIRRELYLIEFQLDRAFVLQDDTFERLVNRKYLLRGEQYNLTKKLALYEKKAKYNLPP